MICVLSFVNFLFRGYLKIHRFKYYLPNRRFVKELCTTPTATVIFKNVSNIIKSSLLDSISDFVSCSRNKAYCYTVHGRPMERTRQQGNVLELYWQQRIQCLCSTVQFCRR